MLNISKKPAESYKLYINSNINSNINSKKDSI